MNDAERFALLTRHLGHTIVIEPRGDGDVAGLVCTDCRVTLEEVEEPIDTSNDLLVGSSGDKIVVGLGPLVMEGVDYETALRMAAWIVALADPRGQRFPRILDAVHNT